MKPAKKRKKLGTVFFATLCSCLVIAFSFLAAKDYIMQHNKSAAAQETGETLVSQTEPELSAAQINSFDCPVSENAKINKNIEKTYKSIINEYEKLYSDSTEKDELKIDSLMCETDEIFSMLLHISYDGKDYMEACCFSAEDGRKLKPTEVFNSNYREYLWDYFERKLWEVDLGGASLAEEYRSSIDGDVRDFNDFILEQDGGAIFFFGPGRLADSNEWVEVKIDRDVLSGEYYDSHRVDPDKPMLALTFEGGPHEVYTNEILDCLEKYGVSATFFDTGANAEKYPEIERRARSINCEIGSHTYNQELLAYMSEEELAKDKKLCDRAFTGSIGAAPKLLRPPEESLSVSASNFFDDEILVGWSIDTQDRMLRDPNAVMGVIKSYFSLDGQVLRMNCAYEESAETVEELVSWLVEQGYQLVTVSDLFRYGYKIEPEPHTYYSYSFFINGRPDID